MRKKWLSIAVASSLLLGSAPSVLAADALSVTINGEPVTFTDAVPYQLDSGIMVPLRTTAEKLGFYVSYDPATTEIKLSYGEVNIALKSGTGSVIVNAQEVSFEGSSVMVANRVYVPLSFFEQALNLQVSYDTNAQIATISVKAQTPEALLNETLTLLLNGNYEELWNEYFNDTMQAAVPLDNLSAVWEDVEAQAGTFQGLGNIQVAADESTTYIAAVAQFEKLSIQVTIAVDSASRISGLQLQPVFQAEEATAPATVIEEEIVLNAGTDIELGGTLTLPANATGPVPAVVLVQGSGASDRDETAMAYKPFRDLAWGLAEQGIAVLRYDKRTYVYGAGSTPEEAARLTVKEEAVDDAIAASALLKQDERIDSSKVYLIGHSQGGMLAPRIDTEGGDFAGLVLLAGSPRPLWEIIYDQNMAVIETMDDADPRKAEGLALIEAEYKKAASMAGMTEEEALTTAVFGMPAYYFQEMDRFDAGQLAAELEKPILVLQGEDDFQIYADKDYVLWQELLGHKENVTFKLYPGLNHFFVDYSGPGENTLNEYAVPGKVSEEVIADLAAWILKQE